MSALIIAFPSKPIDEARRALADCPFNEPIALTSKDADLAYLVLLAERLVNNILDAPAMGHFCASLEAYDASDARMGQ